MPVMLGTNRDEPALFITRYPRYVDYFFEFLPRLKDSAAYLRMIKYGALGWKERGVDSLARAMSVSGNPSVYAYRFDWDEEPSQLGFDLSQALGTAHGLEIASAFNNFQSDLGINYIYPGNDAEFAMADSMRAYWTEFATKGNLGRGQDGKQVLWFAGGLMASAASSSIALPTKEFPWTMKKSQRAALRLNCSAIAVSPIDSYGVRSMCDPSMARVLTVPNTRPWTTVLVAMLTRRASRSSKAGLLTAHRPSRVKLFRCRDADQGE